MSNKFPDNFLWGAATSSHQVEGNNLYNDWWEWEQAGNSEPSGKACDHYNRFREDFRLAKELEHNAHRLSLEWSRLEKEEGKWDQTEWNHYKEVVDELLKLGITPLVTLNHFTVPLWFKRRGEWLNENCVSYFTRFAVKAIAELGERVEWWITINEPHILAFLAHYTGEWPPCHKDFGEALAVIRNLIRSHSAAYHKMHEYAAKNSKIKKPKIGIAKAVTAFHPCHKYSLRDQLVTKARSRLHNLSFSDSVIKGYILTPGLKHEKLPKKNALDFIGLNYYFRQFIHFQRPFKKHALGEVCSFNHHPNAGEITDMGWEVYPQGLYEIVNSFCRYKLPIIITENGIATTDDSRRTCFIKDHLSQLLKVINKGAPVMGYLHWSLMDNFEWAHGYSKRFGLVEVDFNSQKRTIRDSARYYASVIKTGMV